MVVLSLSHLLLWGVVCLLVSGTVAQSMKFSVDYNFQRDTRITAITASLDNVVSYLQCWMLCKNLDNTCHHISYNDITRTCLKSGVRIVDHGNSIADKGWNTFRLGEKTKNGAYCESDAECADNNAICFQKLCFCKRNFRYNTLTHACDLECRLSSDFVEFPGYTFDNFTVTESEALELIWSLDDCYLKCKKDLGAELYTYGWKPVAYCYCQSVTQQQLLDSHPEGWQSSPSDTYRAHYLANYAIGLKNPPRTNIGVSSEAHRGMPRTSTYSVTVVDIADFQEVNTNMEDKPSDAVHAQDQIEVTVEEDGAIGFTVPKKKGFMYSFRKFISRVFVCGKDVEH